MKIAFFHLMPYRPLDFAERAKHRSAWVVLPNDLYDPHTGADEYESYLNQLTYAEELGFDIIAVNEHHQTAYGMMPAPNLIASALIQRTKTAKIAILGRALPLVSNPIAIAEEFAMLDNLSRGRIITGFVRGIGTEYHATGINPVFSHGRFHEAHDLIVAAWTRTGPFEFEGEHYNFRLCKFVATSLPDSAPADMDSFARLIGNHQVGGSTRTNISVLGHVPRRRSGDPLSQSLSRTGAKLRL